MESGLLLIERLIIFNFYSQNHQYYSWVDGNRLQFAYWAEGAPVATTVDTCVKYNTTDSKWYQEYCDREYEYVCKHTSVPPSTPSPYGDCPAEFDNLDIPDFCQSHVHLENQPVSFYEALSGCFFLGGSLISIHNELSNKVITEYSEHHLAIIGLYFQQLETGLSFCRNLKYFFDPKLVLAFQDQVILSGRTDHQMMAIIIGEISSPTSQKVRDVLL